MRNWERNQNIFFFQPRFGYILTDCRKSRWPHHDKGPLSLLWEIFPTHIPTFKRQTSYSHSPLIPEVIKDLQVFQAFAWIRFRERNTPSGIIFVRKQQPPFRYGCCRFGFVLKIGVMNHLFYLWHKRVINSFSKHFQVGLNICFIFV